MLKITDDYLNFFQGESCENRIFKGRIPIKYVPNWILGSDNYTCDVLRITSDKPDNANKDSRWNSTIDCYECI